jgi:cytochrome oxidase Cu insertion factor (SCO1/SenC/PrrC family)
VSNDATRIRRNIRVPAIMLGSLILIILASTLLFRASVLGDIDLPALLGTKNKGTLLQPPQPIADLPLQTATGEPFDFAALPKQWSIVLPVGRHCDERCVKMLYTTRQLHVALGKHAERVRRFLVATEYPLDADFQRLLAEHPKLTVLVGAQPGFDQYFQKAGLQPLQNRQYFIVDPDGWMMMYYNDQQDGKEVMADLKFLLTNSHENEGGN